MEDPVRNLAQHTETAKGIATWIQLVLMVITLSSIVSFAGLKVLDVPTTDSVEAQVMTVDQLTTERINGLEESIDSLEEQLQQTDQTVLCILWDVPPERCEAAARGTP